MSELKLSSVLASSEASLLAGGLTTFLLCPHVGFVCVRASLVSLCVPKFPLIIKTLVFIIRTHT